MMILINDETTLRRYLPNAFATVDEETSIFDKLEPCLQEAEQWLIDNIVGDCISSIDPTSQIFSNMQSFVVADAFSKAIPSLDLVLTPNGFGIVNTNSVVPASKDRVERLIQSLILHKDRMIALILHRLSEVKQWYSTKQCQWLSQSLIQNYNFVLKENCPDRWNRFLELRTEFQRWQNIIANEWLSPELLSRLMIEKATSYTTKESCDVIADLDSVVSTAIKYDCLDTDTLLNIVNYIRIHSGKFPEWGNSELAKLFTEDIFFRNNMNNGGFFF